jgi:hypothetical protein
VGTKGNGGNFVAVDTYGDAVPAYASNETAIGPVAPANQPLYGQVLHIGAPIWQAPLSLEAAAYGPAILFGGKQAQVAAEATLFAGNLLDHLPLTQAYALGVTLPPPTNAYGVAVDTIGNTSGPVLNVGNDTVSQLLAYIKQTNGNTDALTPPTTIAAGATGQSRYFVDAMASIAPRGALVTGFGKGVQASNGLPGLAASAGPIQHDAHVMAA